MIPVNPAIVGIEAVNPNGILEQYVMADAGIP